MKTPAAVSLVLVCAATAAHAGPTTRANAVALAQAYADHQWHCATANTKASCTSGYTSDYTPGDYVGLPYDWGGYKSLAEFDNDLANGQGAGSHSWHGVLECTTGVDCSGYVSKCWDTGHYSTSTINKVASQIKASEMLPADIFNDAGSHMVLLKEFAPDGSPIFYEASGSAKRVRLNTTGGWSYVNGYMPMRFKDFDGSPVPPTGPAGTVNDPIVVTSYPYTDSRNTSFAQSDQFDYYSCAPQTRETGGEYLYRLVLPSPGDLTINVSDGTGADADVQLLSAPDANQCLDRNDTDISYHSASGDDLWLAVDTWSKSAGVEYPGAYTLTINFVSTAPPDDEELPPEPDAGTPGEGGEGAEGSEGAEGQEGTEGLEGIEGAEGVEGAEGTEGAIEGFEGALEGAEGSIEGVEGFVEGAEGFVEGTEGSVEGFEGSAEGLEGTIEGGEGAAPPQDPPPAEGSEGGELPPPVSDPETFEDDSGDDGDEDDDDDGSGDDEDDGQPDSDEAPPPSAGTGTSPAAGVSSAPPASSGDGCNTTGGAAGFKPLWLFALGFLARRLRR